MAPKNTYQDDGKPHRPSFREYHKVYDHAAALRQTLSDRLAGQLTQDPRLAEEITRQIDDLVNAVVESDLKATPVADKGLAELAGIGPQAASEIGQTRLPHGIEAYDEQVTSERILALGDLYYLYQHERIGVFRVVQKLQELFRAGSVRLSSGSGAFSLYQFDRRQVLRYTRRDRLSAYRRAFGYGTAVVLSGSRPNVEFHRRFSHFVNQVTLFWRDKRISDVIRERAQDPSFGSIAVVRRAGLDLRNNLKSASYGHLNVLRVEVMQLLDEAFRILKSPDIMKLFGSENAWDVVEDVTQRYFNEQVVTSPRQRMAIAGREVLRWLAQPHILESTRSEFEAMLHNIAEDAEEWLTSAQSMGLAQRGSRKRIMPWDRRTAANVGKGARGREFPTVEGELELEI